MPSLVIRSFHYRADERVLDVIFTTGRRYLFHDVPADVAERFAASFSKGRYFNAHIRGHFAFTEVATAES